MATIDSKFEEIRELINLEEFNILTKWIIDLTLDTGSMECYEQTNSLLCWLDTDRPAEQKKDKFKGVLNMLYKELSKKQANREDKVLIAVSNIVHSYKNSTFTLGPISFDIHEGQIIGLVGENGNGKTTLLRTLCGELQATGGSIEYNFPYEDTYDLRSKLVYIPQRTPSWQGSLLSNLRFTAASYGITDRENVLMTELIVARMGLRQYRSYKWKDLSSGYKMRFELARALLRKPRFLLIDEPLANLDIVAQQVVLDDLRDIAGSMFRPVGIILSSQQLYEVEKTSDTVIFLKDGKPRNLRDDSDVTAAEVPKFIIEFETDWKTEQLKEAFQPLGLERIQINGGTYVATFPDTVTQDIFLQTVIEQQIPLNYFRNISASTRRFFLS